MVDTFKVGKKYFLKVSELSNDFYEAINNHSCKRDWLDGKPKLCQSVMTRKDGLQAVDFKEIPAGHWLYPIELRKHIYEYSHYEQEEMEL